MADFEAHGLGKRFRRGLAGHVGRHKRLVQPGRGRSRVDKQAATLPPHRRQYGAVHPQPGHGVGIEYSRELFRREGLAHADHQHAGIVHGDVNPALLGQDLVDRRATADFRQDIEFDNAQIYAVFPRKAFEFSRRVLLRCAMQRIDA